MPEPMPTLFSGRPLIEEVAPDVFRLDLPVPQILGSTNSYVIKGDAVHGDGRSLIVDVGCSHPATKVVFDSALTQLGIAWDAVDVFITHYHWDHCAGLGRVWRPGMRVFGGLAHYADRPSPIMAAEDIGRMERAVSARHGVTDAYDPDYWKPMTDRGFGDYPLTVVGEGDALEVGRYRFRVLETPGHEVHHRCLYDETSGLFVGGDQLLTSLYPSVFLETETDQLADLFITMKRLGQLDASLVLCGHGAEGHDLAARCRQITAHYERQVEGFLKFCEPGLTDPGELAYRSTMQERRTPWEHRAIFGRRALLGQTMGYLRYLVNIGELPDVYDLTLLK